MKGFETQILRVHDQIGPARIVLFEHLQAFQVYIRHTRDKCRLAKIEGGSCHIDFTHQRRPISFDPIFVSFEGPQKRGHQPTLVAI